MKVGWASRPSKKDGRDAHPTIKIKIVSYLIRDPYCGYLAFSYAGKGKKNIVSGGGPQARKIYDTSDL